MRDLRDNLYRHLQSLPVSFFTNTRTGEIQSRVSNDVASVQNVVTSTVSNVISNGVIFISTLAAMFVLSWELTLVAMGAVPFFAGMTKVIGERRRVVTAEAQRSTAEMTAITQETLSISGIMLSKLFGRQSQEIARFSEENQRLSDLAVRQQMTGQSFWAAMQVFFSISPVVIYVLAGYILSGETGAVSDGPQQFGQEAKRRVRVPQLALFEIGSESQGDRT